MARARAYGPSIELIEYETYDADADVSPAPFPLDRQRDAPKGLKAFKQFDHGAELPSVPEQLRLATTARQPPSQRAHECSTSGEGASTEVRRHAVQFSVPVPHRSSMHKQGAEQLW